MVSAVRRIGAKRLLIGLTAVALGLAVSMGTGHCVSESPESGGITPSETAMEKKPKLDVPYEPTAYEIAQEMLRTADVRKDDFVYDLGCGDGRIVIAAVKEKGAHGVCVDIDPQRIREARANAAAAGVLDRIRFLEQDLFETDIGEATVVVLFLWPEVNLKLRPKLWRELRQSTRVISYVHDMGDWEPQQTMTVQGRFGERQLYLWTIASPQGK